MPVAERSAVSRVLPFVFLIAVSCGGNAPAPNAPSTETPPAATQSAAPVAAPALAAPSASASAPAPESDEAPGIPRVTLLDPGKEPRRRLRYTFTMKPETLVLDMETKMAMRLGDKSMPETELPTIRTVMRLTPTNVSPEGDLTYEGVTTRTEVMSNGAVPDIVRQKMQASMKSMEGMKVTSTVSSRGVARDATMEIPENAAPEIRQALEGTREALKSMCMPLPEEDVGAGASWRTDMIMQTTFRLKQSTTTTLTKLEPNRMTLESALKQAADPQPFAGPSVPAGTSMKLERLTGTGGGTLVIQLDHLVPTSNVTLESETQMTVSAGGQSMQTGTVMHLFMKIHPGK